MAAASGGGRAAPADASPSSTRPSSTRSLTVRETGSSAQAELRRRGRPTVVPPPTATIWRQRSASMVTSSLGQLGAQRDPAAERGHDGLDRLPLLEHRLGRVEGVLDLGRRRRHRPATASSSKTKSPSLKRSSSNSTSVAPSASGARLASLATIAPSASQSDPEPLTAAQAQPTRLVGRRQQAQDVGKGKGFERALKSHGDLRKGDELSSIGTAARRIEGLLRI